LIILILAFSLGIWRILFYKPLPSPIVIRPLKKIEINFELFGLSSFKELQVFKGIPLFKIPSLEKPEEKPVISIEEIEEMGIEKIEEMGRQNPFVAY